MKKNKFLLTLAQTEEYLYSSYRMTKQIREIYGRGEKENAFRLAFTLQPITERIALLGRSLPTYTAYPQARFMVDKIIENSVPVNIGFTKEGWFSVRLPMLLPKKEKGRTDYIRQILYPVMQSFFTDKEPRKLQKAVLIYRHVYDETDVKRRQIDHDNFDMNTVSDIIALYVLRDDCPSACSHFHCSAFGDKDRTEIYAVPKEDFIVWLEAEKTMPKGGVTLYENTSKA